MQQFENAWNGKLHIHKRVIIQLSITHNKLTLNVLGD